MSQAADTLEYERSERLAFARLEQNHKTVRTLIRAAATVSIAAVVVYGLGGQFTQVNVNLTGILSLLAELRVSIWIGLSGAAAIWAVVERRLRYHKVEKLAARVKELELKVDPNRTSSG